MIWMCWSVVILLAGAAASIILMRHARAALLVGLAAVGAASALALIAGIGVLTAPALHPPVQVQWNLPLGHVRLMIDSLSAWFLVGIGILSLSVAIYSWGYLQNETGPGHGDGHEAPGASHGLFAALLCLLVASMIVLVCAEDVVFFLLAWETMSLAAFFLIGFHDQDSEVRHAAWMYLIATHLGTAIFLLPMFGILVGQAGHGQTQLATSFEAITHGMRSAPPALLVVIFVLGLIGFGTKAGFMPMHVWLPRAHPVAPSPISAMMSGIVIKTGIYGLLRLLTWLPPLPISCAIVMIAVAAVSGVLGVLYAVAQHQLKRLLAYHSIENIGIIGLGIGIGMLGRTLDYPFVAMIGFAGAVLHVINHALFKGLLFLSAGCVIQSTGTGEIEHLGGLLKKIPAAGIMFLIGAVAICGLPPLNGFVSEWLIYVGLFRGAGTGAMSTAWSPIVGIASLAIIGGLALACFTKVFGAMFLGEPRRSDIEPKRTPLTMIIGMAPPAIACILIGMCCGWLPEPLMRVCQPLTISPAWGDNLNAHLKQIDDAMAPLPQIAVAFMVLTMLIALLSLARLLVPAKYPSIKGPPTWGCGYAYPQARMQYSASSFAWTLLSAAKRVLPVHRDVQPPTGYFPTSGSLASHTPDAAESRFFEPLFRRTADLFQRLWPLQHGRLHVYVMYIVTALVGVFFVEAVWKPYAKAPPPASDAPAAQIDHAGRTAQPISQADGRTP